MPDCIPKLKALVFRVIVEIKEISFFAITNVLVLRGLGRTELLLLNLGFACLLGSSFGFVRFVMLLVSSVVPNQTIRSALLPVLYLWCFHVLAPLWPPCFELDLSK